MRKLFLPLVAALLLPITTHAKDFDYSRTQYIFAVMSDEAIIYAKFPAFIDLRNTFTEAMQDASPDTVVSSAPLYTFRLVGVGELSELQVGSDWIGDGRRSAKLNETQFSFIKRMVDHRDGTGVEPEKLDSIIARYLREQDAPVGRRTRGHASALARNDRDEEHHCGCSAAGYCRLFHAVALGYSCHCAATG